MLGFVFVSTFPIMLLFLVEWMLLAALPLRRQIFQGKLLQDFSIQQILLAADSLSVNLLVG